jgi:hypothetical protein
MQGEPVCKEKSNEAGFVNNGFCDKQPVPGSGVKALHVAPQPGQNSI